MISRAAVASLALLGLSLCTAAHAQAPCAPEGGVDFICGLTAPEDLIRLPDTNWIIVSGMADAASHRGQLYAVDAKSKEWKSIYPSATARVNHDKKTYGSCPGPLSSDTFGAHGIDIRPKGQGMHTLLAVNHAVRESIEVFELDAKGALPVLTWVGCVVLPDGTSGNGVVALPEGGFVTTNFKDPADTAAFQKMSARQITGNVLEWHAGKGWSVLPESAMSGANGVALSPDGKSLYVAGWPDKNVTRWERSGAGGAWAKKESIDTGILTDNLRWMSDGTLLAGGQDADMPGVFQCGPPKCKVASGAVKIDTRTGEAKKIMSYPGAAGFDGGTTAIEVGDEIWFGSFRADRVARVPLR